MKNILILTNPNSIITRNGRRIVVKTENEIQEYQTGNLYACILFGNIQLTNQAIRLLTDEGILITNLTFDGEACYSILPAKYINYDLRIRQYETYKSEENRLKIARYIVLKKIEFSFQFIKSSKSRHKTLSIKKLRKEFNKIYDKVCASNTIDELLGYEGNFSKIYFNCLKEISNGKVKFSQRSKRPPKDEANALMSFIYTLTYTLISNLLFAAGFDPYIGFLHSEDYGRNSFALDILELFRANFCDRFFINITNRNIMLPKHFQQTEEKGYLLNNEGKKKFFELWRKAVYDYDKPSASIIYKIQEQLNVFSKVFRNKGEIIASDFNNL